MIVNVNNYTCLYSLYECVACVSDCIKDRGRQEKADSNNSQSQADSPSLSPKKRRGRKRPSTWQRDMLSHLSILPIWKGDNERNTHTTKPCQTERGDRLVWLWMKKKKKGCVSLMWMNCRWERINQLQKGKEERVSVKDGERGEEQWNNYKVWQLHTHTQ